MRKIFTLLIVAILATATSWAATTGTIKFGTNNVKIDKASVTAADDQGNSWKITTVGTEYFGQQSQYTQVGSADAPATSITFTTTLSKEVKVSSLSVKFGGFKNTAGTIKLLVGDKEIGAGKLNAKNDVTVTSTTVASGTQLTVTVTNITKGVKCYNITYTYEDSAEPEKAVKSLAITGEPTNKEYYVGGKFNPAGLVVTATYEDEITAPVTPYVTWTFNPTEFTEVAENVEVAVKASYKGKDANTTAIVSVNKAPSKLFIDLDKDETTTATAEKIEWVKDLVTVTNTQGNGGTAANNYYPGKGSTYKYTRFYSKSTLTFTPKEGLPISSIVYVAQSTNYATIMANSTWTNATAKVEGETVTISPTDGSKTISAKIGGTTGGHSFTILFGNETPKALQSIAISGTPQTEYTEGETFSAEGLTVTATYDDASTAVVTADANWTFEPATLAVGTTSVTATATYNEKTASETYNVTVKEIPSYTYTWMVNGAEVKKSVLKEGAAVEVPADPENIADKVFTGWVTTATVDANVTPTYATIDATAKANTTYYAVFATLKQGAGEKWVKKAASEITEEGVYALITKDGYAFNGEITKGHGQSTAATFVFDKNNEATSAPEGTCELTFVKKGEGYSINRDGTNRYKYLCSKDVGSGKLDWAIAEQNYWYYDEAKGSWAYKVRATETAYLNVYNTNNTFRTYYQAGSTSPVYFAQKVAGAGYADFTTIVKTAEVTTLANLAVNGAEGAAYQVNDEMVVAKKFQKAGKNYIVVKDAAKAVRNFSTPAADDKFFNINGNKQEEYAQNNWMLVSLPVELYNQVNEKNTVITSITGTLTEKFNVAMTATNVVAGEAADFAPNTYCALNFMGESSVKGNNPAYTSSYYFATPKANEYANVVWAVYNGTDGAFYLPVHQGSANAQEFKAAFKVDYSLNSVATPELVNGDMYSFEALVKEVAVATTEAKSAPRKTAYDSTVAPSTKFVVYPLDLDANKVATGVNDVNSAKEVKGVSYFNMMGVESAQPFDGVNIMVTTYTDGTQSAAKVLR